MRAQFFFLSWFPVEFVVRFLQRANGQQYSRTKFTVFAEKKGNCDVERVNTDNKKYTTIKTLNNFEILCQQTWLNRLCHTFDANRVIAMAMLVMRSMCFFFIFLIEIHIDLRIGSLESTGLAWLRMHKTDCECMCVCRVWWPFLRMRKKRQK